MKCNILGIAPYEGLKEIMEAVAAARDDVALTVYTGDLSEGALVANRIQDQGFDVIVSRGGTARMIEGIARVPVVEIAISGYDMLRVIRLAKEFRGRCAIVGFPAIAGSARLIAELVQEDTDIFTIHSAEEAEACLHELMERGYGLIVGDTVTAKQSRKLGLNSVLITSGVESVAAAFDQAVNLCRVLRKREEERALLEALLAGCDQIVAAFTEDGRAVLRSLDTAFPPEWAAMLQKHVPAVLSGSAVSLARKRDGQVVCIQGKRVTSRSAAYAAFYCKVPATPPSWEGLWITARDTAEGYAASFNALYSENPAMRALISQAAAFSQSSAPVLVRGELGTGKDAIVAAIHAESAQRGNTLLTIDAQQGTVKRWSALLRDDGSPLCRMGLGIYFKNAQAIPREAALTLREYLHSAQVHRRNRLYFGWQMRGAGDAEDPLLLFLLDRLGCLALTVPPLRDRVEDIQSLSSIYISRFNQKYGRQVVGFDEEAAALLQAFGWGQNFYQLQQLVSEAVLLTDTARITTETVAQILGKLAADTPTAPPNALDLAKPLDALTTDIIRLVLREENNNHSRAAQRLGISRGTLWRKLKDMDGREAEA